MKFTSIAIQSWPEYGDGLGDIQMSRLGEVVVLAGPNGAGKSRLLRRLVSAIPRDRKATVASLKSQIKHLEHELGVMPHVALRSEYARQLTEARRTAYLLEGVCIQGQRLPVTAFLPTNLNLRDCFELSAKQLAESAAIVTDEPSSGSAFDQYGAHTLAAIQSIQNKYFEATHPNATTSEDTRRQCIAKYSQLSTLIQSFLGTTLTRTSDGQIELFGQRAGISSLSHGQKLLLQLALGLHEQAERLKELVIVMDEPENHMHPSVMLEGIDIVRNNIPHGQLWIATHSIPILAHFDPSSIWWMENGTASYAGNTPRRVLRGLLGNEERISRLASFLNLPFDLASAQFSYQCLCDPPSVGFKVDDPQLNGILRTLKDFPEGKRTVLDFGAGRGRLASAIWDAFGENAKAKIDYFGYDSNARDAEACCNAIARIYGSSEGRYFNDSNSFLSKVPYGIGDFAIMCNVLHEIPSEEWGSLFGPNGIIAKFLRDDGFLLLVEDMNLPVGEKPHQKGFLVLDTPQLKTLFKITKKDCAFQFTEEREGRLKAHFIPKSCLGRIDANSRREAIREVALRSQEEVLKLRKSESTFQNGRLHGFWVQQFANANLVLGTLQ
jgi:ABC-type cobalamin/Fe3+-siderophores transport system ATPase subunit